MPSYALPFPGKLMGFVTTSNASSSRGFYEGKLGCRFVSEDPQALMFDADGHVIRLQKAAQHTPARGTVLGWTVPDIGAAVAGLAAKGVPCERFGFPGQDERGVMRFPDGAQVAWFKDPDGNVLSVSQLPR